MSDYLDPAKIQTKTSQFGNEFKNFTLPSKNRKSAVTIITALFFNFRFQIANYFILEFDIQVAISK